MRAQKILASAKKPTQKKVFEFILGELISFVFCHDYNMFGK